MSSPPRVIEPLSSFRQLVRDGMELAGRKHCMHGLIEIDITETRRRLQSIKEATGESISFTGFVVYCCARAVDEDKHLQAYLDWRNRLVIFDDVDVSLPVERTYQGKPVVLQTVIRAANRKSVAQIHREIRALQATELDETPWGRWLRWYVWIPRFFRRLVFRLAQRAPTLVKRFNGTVLVTAVGMFGTGTGWGIPLPGHTLCVTIGGVDARSVLMDEHVQQREYLCVTVSFDHDIVDGAPAARFSQRLAALIRAGEGLAEML